MKEKLWIAGAVVVAIIATTVWRANMGHDVPEFVPALVTGVIVFGAGISALIVRRRAERNDLSREPDSVERIAATEAQAKTFIDAVVLGTILGCALIIWDVIPASVAVIGLVVVLVIDFYVRFAVLKSHAVAER